jgi:hypothetical protein
MTVCTIKNTPCRHCSMATYTHVKREGHILDKNFKKSTERIELGLFCNNVSAWIEKMKVCPMDTCLKLQDIPVEQMKEKHKIVLRFWKKGGVDVSKL